MRTGEIRSEQVSGGRVVPALVGTHVGLPSSPVTHKRFSERKERQRAKERENGFSTLPAISHDMKETQMKTGTFTATFA